MPATNKQAFSHLLHHRRKIRQSRFQIITSSNINEKNQKFLLITLNHRRAYQQNRDQDNLKFEWHSRHQITYLKRRNERKRIQEQLQEIKGERRRRVKWWSVHAFLAPVSSIIYIFRARAGSNCATSQSTENMVRSSPRFRGKEERGNVRWLGTDCCKTFLRLS